MKVKFRIRFKAVHDKMNVTFYRVAKETGLSNTTVRKYADFEYVDSEYIPPAVVMLARFYGVDWRSEEIIEVIEDGE